MAALTGALIVGGLSAAGSIGSALIGSKKESGPSSDDIRRQLDAQNRATPLGASTIGRYLSAQALYELGVPIQAIEDELWAQEIAVNDSPTAARSALQRLNSARVALAKGNATQAQKILGGAPPNTRVGAFGEISRFRTEGGGTPPINASIINGQIRINPTGAASAQIQELRKREEQSRLIFQNRLASMEEISRGTAAIRVPGAEDIARREQESSSYLNTYLARAQEDESRRILANANKLGFSPAGQLGRLETRLGDERSRIASTGALERALALINAEQASAVGAINAIKGGLNPSLLAGSLDQSAQALSSGGNANAIGAQLAVAQAEAEAARSVSRMNATQDAFGNLSSLAQAYLLYGRGSAGGS